MTDSGLPPITALRYSWLGAMRSDTCEPLQDDALSAELHAAVAREAALRRECENVSQRQQKQLQEFEHRVFNGLQMVSGMLLLQGLRATPETAVHLSIAAGRVAALGRVHQRLHCLDGQEKVAFKEYLQHLCEDISALLFEEETGHAIVLQGSSIELPTALGIPLGLIVNELITNSAKFAKGQVIVRIETVSPGCHALLVLDDGPGLPAEFDPAKSKGLGMKIVLSLVKEIGGKLHIFPGNNGRGTCFMVTFRSSGTQPSVVNSCDVDRDDGHDGVLFLNIGQCGQEPAPRLAAAGSDGNDARLTYGSVNSS